MPAFRPNRIYVHPDLQSHYDRIEAAAKSGRKHGAGLWKSLRGAIERIRLDAQWGEVIPRIPSYFAQRYNVANLCFVDLAYFHRAFYTIFHRDVVLLDVFDHRQYDRWFGKRGRR